MASMSTVLRHKTVGFMTAMRRFYDSNASVLRQQSVGFMTAIRRFYDSNAGFISLVSSSKSFELQFKTLAIFFCECKKFKNCTVFKGFTKPFKSEICLCRFRIYNFFSSSTLGEYEETL